jgi:hypothetical protein
MKGTKKPGIVLLTTVFLFTACSKEGSHGLVGQQGEQGPKGDKGDTGQQGPTGTANAIYSDWMRVFFTTLGGSFDGIKYYFGTMDAPKLTQAILDKREVTVYMNNTGVAPPYVVKLLGYEYPSEDRFYIRINRLRVRSIELIETYLPPGAIYFRYVIIPGGVHTRILSPPPDLNDYHAVCQYYETPQ